MKDIRSKSGFLDCVPCKVWSWIPEGFKEMKHFGKCPKCGRAMFLTRSISPAKLGFKESDRVEAGLMFHLERAERTGKK